MLKIATLGFGLIASGVVWIAQAHPGDPTVTLSLTVIVTCTGAILAVAAKYFTDLARLQKQLDQLKQAHVDSELKIHEFKVTNDQWGNQLLNQQNEILNRLSQISARSNDSVAGVQVTRTPPQSPL